MSGMKIFQLNHAEKIQEHAKWDCGEHDEFSQEHIEKCLNKMLSAYVDDDRNYVVDYAEIECTDMCSYEHCIRYQNGKTRLYDVIKEGGGGAVERDYIPAGRKEGEIYFLGDRHELLKMRKLHALHAQDASANGIRFATVVDNICLRDVREGIKRIDMPMDGLPITCEANIVSMGNCRIMRESDIPEIEKRLEESMKYGTCYSLIKLTGEWVNPLCTEEITGNCYEEDVGDEDIIRPPCTEPRHHQTMKFDTKYGEQEGLTMLSTLLCNRGGVITIKVHGQIYLDRDTTDTYSMGTGEIINVKEEILKLYNQENGLQLVREYIDKIKAENPDYVQFLELLAARESSGGYGEISESGSYLGRYQIGDDVFKDIGFKDKDTNNWTDLAKAFGVNSKESYLKNPIAQEVAILFALRWDYYYVLDNGDDVMLTEYADDVEVTTSGLIAAAHLVGHSDLHKAFIGEQTWDNTVDGNKVKASEYMEEMGGLDLSGILGGVELAHE